jgi:DNA-directed RNA polymerase subunit RPC12/RpoP
MNSIDAGVRVPVTGRAATGSWLRCALWGHVVDNEAFTAGRRACVRCGIRFLQDEAGAVVRIGHTLSCFFRHHTYERAGVRDGHTEYACVRCGHPLLFRSDADPYASSSHFEKRVRYRCGLFGHRVHVVTSRAGGVEYACGCGHSFIQRPVGESRVTHPLKCFFLAHWVRFVERRGHHSEYACRPCGHPFLFTGHGGHGSARKT